MTENAVTNTQKYPGHPLILKGRNRASLRPWGGGLLPERKGTALYIFVVSALQLQVKKLRVKSLRCAALLVICPDRV